MYKAEAPHQKRRFCATCELSKCQTRGAYGARGARNLTNAPVTRLFCESYMWRRANISAPVDDPTAEPPPLRDIQILFIKGVTPSIIAKRGRKETGCPGCFWRRCRGFASFLTSNLPSPCQAVLLHPRGPDRHPAITPSHDPKLFFPHPTDTFFSILTVQPKRPEGARER